MKNQKTDIILRKSCNIFISMTILGLLISFTHQKQDAIKTSKETNKQINDSMIEKYSWYFYRSDKLINSHSHFRDTKTFDGYNILHYHRNSAGFFRTYSKCPSKFEKGEIIQPVHISLGNSYLIN